MVERGILYFIVYLFLLHGLVKGFEVRGHNGNKGHQTLTEKPCVSIVVTDSETYKGTVYLIYLFNIFIVSYFNYLSEEGTSTLRFKNVKELLKLREDILFSSRSKWRVDPLSTMVLADRSVEDTRVVAGRDIVDGIRQRVLHGGRWEIHLRVFRPRIHL